LIDCLFGTSVSKSEIENGWDGRSVKIQYDRYPEMTTLLEELLQDSDEGNVQKVETVLPALEILRRAGPPSHDSAELTEQVINHLSNPSWHVREMAARTYCALTMKEELGSLLHQLLDGPTDNTNLLHGTLLAVGCLLERRAALDNVESKSAPVL
jgi:hypothetical protein